MNLLDVTKMKAIKSADQNNTFTLKHVRYTVMLKRMDTGATVCFEYQCNPKYSEPTLDDCMYCYLSDATAYECSDGDIDVFAANFGYNKVGECIKAFNGCKDSYIDLLDYCGSKEVYEWLKQHYEDY